jgi:predicted nucleic acid-binding protein
MLYALDTCTITFLFKGNISVENKFNAKLENKVLICIPPIAYYETIRGFMAVDAQRKLNGFENFYNDCYFPDIIERQYMRTCADLYVACRKNGRPMGENDLLIGAWCLLAGAILVTDNVKHFQHIDGLTIENWKVINN